MKRRSFIQTVTASAAAVLISNLVSSCNDKAKRLPSLGYISGMIPREVIQDDWRSALTRTVEMGYNEIEIGRHLGDSPESFLEFCDGIGLKPIAGGATFSEDMNEVNISLDRLNNLGLQYAVVYWPWFEGDPVSMEQVKVSTELLNKIGEACKNKGLVFCWHNHACEFSPPIDGVIPFDYIMENTDSELVKCQLDIYWVKRGGADPLEVLKKYRGRYPLLHVKDMYPGTQQSFACPGSGIIDFQTILAEAMDQNIMHYMVERDGIGSWGMDCLESAAGYLKSLRF